ncbi:unnamed protein product [Rhizoctonia solani]|uniref:Zn(2)-C6 fungal-type domain-containing protein n=1 Tax=Rhizoctonia solani TaxID=456999 RepID=A0A8H2XY11_9AGAM|nr:unnamed protein product [Rhizoctonia solani]
MTTPRRSTTGCTLCKTRHKKCDETKPQCLQCLSSGKPCAYEYVAYPESDRHRVKRTKPAPRSTFELLARKSQSISACHLEVGGIPSSMHSFTDDPTVPSHSISPNTYSDSNLVAPGEILNFGPYSPSKSLVPTQLRSDLVPNYHLPNSLDFTKLPATISDTYDGVPVAFVSALTRTSASLDLDRDDCSNDPEGVRALLYTTPILDKNVRENTLVFVLHCYSEWAIVKVFEPLKVIHTMRDRVVAQISSENTRTRTILIANVMIAFARNLTIDDTRKSILKHLVYEVQKSGSSFMATPASSPTLDRHNAIRTLDNILEIFSLQTSTRPTSECIQLLDYAAPVFRRACFEAEGQPINLQNILLESNLNLRHFVTIDIMKSITTGLPSYFRYEVPSPLGLCERIHQMQDDIGLQWLHGFPDQFIVLFAWINSLRNTPGGSDNLELIIWIEKNLPSIKVTVNESGDPLLRIGRMVVQECWRFAVLIYLYMALCKANAYDHRVVRAQKGFMRLVRGVKPARNPDAYLITPMLVAGIATFEEQDRATLRQRILGVRECTEQATTANDIILGLEDVWERTKNEARGALWSDLGVANFRVTSAQRSNPS